MNLKAKAVSIALLVGGTVGAFQTCSYYNHIQDLEAKAQFKTIQGGRKLAMPLNSEPGPTPSSVPQPTPAQVNEIKADATPVPVSIEAPLKKKDEIFEKAQDLSRQPSSLMPTESTRSEMPVFNMSDIVGSTLSTGDMSLYIRKQNYLLYFAVAKDFEMSDLKTLLHADQKGFVKIKQDLGDPCRYCIVVPREVIAEYGSKTWYLSRVPQDSGVNCTGTESTNLLQVTDTVDASCKIAVLKEVRLFGKKIDRRKRFLYITRRISSDATN